MMSPEVRADWSGLQLFARYAYPPNERGFCGPDDHLALLAYRTAGVVDAGLAELAGTFTGPWPYLELLATRTGAGGPFSERVVEAYWVGNDLLDRIDILDFGNTVAARFRPATGRRWPGMAAEIPGGIPHHSFHVFVTYPWVGLLAETHRGEPLEILDRCRIRWGTVVTADEGAVVARSEPLTWDGRRLGLGAARVEAVTAAVGGFDPPLRPGDAVSMHWGWICDRLTPRQLADLRRFSARQLEMTNARLGGGALATLR